eukprot:9500039-Pyramimonas_sp.AAC.1
MLDIRNVRIGAESRGQEENEEEERGVFEEENNGVLGVNGGISESSWMRLAVSSESTWDLLGG